jgi:hypothetical protein
MDLSVERIIPQHFFLFSISFQFIFVRIPPPNLAPIHVFGWRADRRGWLGVVCGKEEL